MAEEEEHIIHKMAKMVVVVAAVILAHLSELAAKDMMAALGLMGPLAAVAVGWGKQVELMEPHMVATA